jgi:hypothetical protein
MMMIINRSVEFRKKIVFMKPINMGSSFEKFDAEISKVKTVRHLDKQSSKYFILKK